MRQEHGGHDVVRDPATGALICFAEPEETEALEGEQLAPRVPALRARKAPLVPPLRALEAPSAKSADSQA